MKDTADSSAADITEDTPVHVESAGHLDDLVSTYPVVLVDFYADWCGPCKMLEPTVERLAAETDALVAKVDIDELRGLAQSNNVQGVPTMFVYADGELVERMVGVRDESTLRDVVTAHA